jgi:hypothetical protein
MKRVQGNQQDGTGNAPGMKESLFSESNWQSTLNCIFEERKLLPFYYM